MLQLSVIIFRDMEGKILLQFRDENAPSEPLGWSFFGGVAEGDESPLDAVIREVKEELEMELSVQDIRLLVQRHWISLDSRKEKMVYFFEGIAPISWKDFSVREGAGAAFLKKEEVNQLVNVSLLAKTLVAEYC